MCIAIFTSRVGFTPERRGVVHFVVFVFLISGFRGAGDLYYFYWGQLLTAAACRWLFRVDLKVSSVVHSFTDFGRAFHIVVA